LIVIATAAEVEALDLRVLINEKCIVLKPVHRIAFQEALAAAVGVQLASAPLALASNEQLKGHVLLVEDEPVNVAVAQGYLEALGCTSVAVNNGRDAVARATAERFDLILMDLNMPEMDGFAATALIRQAEDKASRVPIVALTAYDATNYRDKCAQADMDDILSKPYTFEDCARALRRWLKPYSQPTPAPRNHVLATSSDHSLISIDAKAVAALRTLRGSGHTNLYEKVVELFRVGSVDSLQQLNAAFALNDLPRAATICHKFSTSAANVGALEFAKQVRRLEQLCSAADTAPARELHEQLRMAHAPLLDALLDFSLRASA
jgi:two-component system sensor histidine kinase/response regulator